MNKTQTVLPEWIQSHELPGSHPLLLSKEAQAKLGMVKDMTSNQVYLKNHDDYVDVYESKGTGLSVICIRNHLANPFDVMGYHP